METGMKEYIRQTFGHFKTKEVLTFDDGLAERQAPFLTVVRPIATALEKLDSPDLIDDEGDTTGPDPDEIKCLLEDALVLLGNANVRLNQWRMKRFSEYLTEVGKRTLKAGIPTDKHLFPDEFHKTVLSEHEHSKTNSKLIAAPKPTTTSPMPSKKPFRPGPQYQSDRLVLPTRVLQANKTCLHHPSLLPTEQKEHIHTQTQLTTRFLNF